MINSIREELPLEGRVHNSTEALLDLFVNGLRPVSELADHWRWQEEDIGEFLQTHEEYVTFIKNLHEENSTKSRRKQAQEIVDIFNEVFNRRVTLNEYRIRTINARITEGKRFSRPIGPAQFRAVFEHKKKEWTGTEQERYLELETLCAAKHFTKYLDQARLAYVRSMQAKKAETEGVKLTGTHFKATTRTNV